MDEQKIEAQNIIKHLESVQEYRPPPKDFTSEILTELQSFKAEIQDRIAKQKLMSQSQQYLQVLKQRQGLHEFSSRTQAFTKKIKNHTVFIEENSRPLIEVRSEVDKFRGFL